MCSLPLKLKKINYLHFNKYNRNINFHTLIYLLNREIFKTHNKVDDSNFNKNKNKLYL